MMKPIIMSNGSVKAILAKKQSQTRRAVKPQPILVNESINGERLNFWSWKQHDSIHSNFSECLAANSPYQPGDLLWVKETWGTKVRYGSYKPSLIPTDAKIYYRTDGEGQSGLNQWRPSIFMPKWVARIFLTVTEVRAERLNTISEEDVYAEGIKPPDWLSNIDSWRIPEQVMREIFSEHWEKLNKPAVSWEANPWVWVVQFKLTEKT